MSSIVGALVNSDHNLWPGMLALVKLKGDTDNVKTVVRIAKRNPKTFKAELPDGRTVTGPHVLFTKAPAGTEFVSTKAIVPAPALTHHDPGTVVRFKVGNSIFTKVGSTPYVVTACGSDGKHRLFPLGGSKRYWRGVLSTEFEVVPIEDITVAY